MSLYKVLARNRYVIEHCFGILKQKFRQLYHLKLRKIRLMVHFIRAACVLHNIAIDNEFNLEDEKKKPCGILSPLIVHFQICLAVQTNRR